MRSDQAGNLRSHVGGRGRTYGLRICTFCLVFHAGGFLWGDHGRGGRGGGGVRPVPLRHAIDATARPFCHGGGGGASSALAMSFSFHSHLPPFLDKSPHPCSAGHMTDSFVQRLRLALPDAVNSSQTVLVYRVPTLAEPGIRYAYKNQMHSHSNPHPHSITHLKAPVASLGHGNEAIDTPARS